MSKEFTFGNMTLRDYQQDTHTKTINYVRSQLTEYKKNRENQPKPAIINAFVGAGKTPMLGAVAHHCSIRNLKCLILARQGELIEQNSDECWNMDAPNSIFSASLGKKSVHYGVVAGTEGTVVNSLNKEFADWLPLVIAIDEAHMVNWQDVLEKGDTDYSKIIRHFNMLADRKQAENPEQLIPRPVIIGYTGSPYRGTESIVGPYWDKTLVDIGREYLVDNGYLVPTIFGFGHDDVQYDFKGFDKVDEVGTGDFSSSQLAEMQKQIELTTTHKIMLEVMEVAKNRNGVLITCAGRKHCEEAAQVLPAGSYGIVTQDIGYKERSDILRKAKTGKLKYVLQVGCLTTGVNVPLWDTSVILRRIGSLTLLVQLLGRGMRLLKPEHIEAGFKKDDHLVLDYAGTMPAMIDKFNDPILEDAELARAKGKFETINCPSCGAENSEHARRCIGRGQSGERCEFFWKSRTCDDLKRGGYTVSKGCGAENDIAARFCRCCENLLIDHNAVLGKHYTDADWKPVERMTMELAGKNQDAIKVKYFLDNRDDDGNQEVATVNYWAILDGGKRVWESKFLKNHVIGGYSMIGKIKRMPATEVINNLRLFKAPEMVTHRINGKGESLVSIGKNKS